MSGNKEATYAAALDVLGPVAKLMLRAHLGVGDLKQLCERAFVRAAVSVETDENRPEPSITQIANRTGLAPTTVRKVRAIDKGAVSAVVRGQSRISRVLGGWMNDPAFKDRAGRPRILPLKGHGSFSELVRQYSKGWRIKPVLTELERLQLVHTQQGRSVELLSGEASDQLDAEGTLALGQAGRDLLEALLERLEHPTGGAGRFFRYIVNERMSEDDAIIQTRDHARQLHSVGNTISGRVEDPQTAVWPADSPQKAVRVGVMLLLSQRPVIIPEKAVHRAGNDTTRRAPAARRARRRSRKD
jgi:hypothetical protein